MMLSLGRQRALLAAIFLAAAIFRIAPGWQAVYGDGLVDLQGEDSYYHLRSVEALIANFPRRPGFDPYALFPGGMNVPTGPFFDYLAATAALVLGGGAPSEELTREVCAWIPPLFGALCVVPIFWLGRALAGPWGGLIAASWFAVCPGHNTYYAKLGFADHHIFETLFYACALAALAGAVSREGHSRRRFALAAGIALGLALLNRPAAAFAGAIFGAWGGLQAGVELLDRRRFDAAPVLAALLIGWLFLLPAGGGAWGVLPHLAIAAGVGAALVSWLLAGQVLRRDWPGWFWAAGMGVGAAVALALVLVAAPNAVSRLQIGLTDAIAGGASRLVAEVRSPIRQGGQWTVRPLFVELGAAGLLAIPAFAAMAWEAFRSRSRALSLVALTGLLYYAATLLQARMSIYAAVNVALAVGWCFLRATENQRPAMRLVSAAAVVGLLFVPAGGLSWAISAREAGLSPEWRAATDWLRLRTPDPLADPEAFLRYYPRLGPGETFDYPPGAYGVLSWWDLGYFVLAAGHRPPIANGTQAGAPEAARFYTSTDVAEATASLDGLGARYVVVDNTLPVVQLNSPDAQGGEIRAMMGWTDQPLADLLGVYDLRQEGGVSNPVLIFYPRYFETMAARLYLHDGLDYEPRNATAVFSIRDTGGPLPIISSQRTFETYDQAVRYRAARPDQRLVLGTLHPYRSCAPLAAVPGLRQVFDSGPEDLVGDDMALRAVKVFERLPAAPSTQE